MINPCLVYMQRGTAGLSTLKRFMARLGIATHGFNDDQE